MNEIWKPIRNYSGLYEVSSLGRVRSLERLDSAGRKVRERLMRPHLNRDGYTVVRLTKNANQENFRVHNLVAEAFLGPRPTNHDVCHGLGGKPDNSVPNLSYGTRRKNTGDDRNRDHVYSSRFPGVNWDRGKWRAQIKVRGKTKHLGRFANEIDAAQAYKDATPC